MKLGIDSLVVFHLKNLSDVISNNLIFVQNLARTWHQKKSVSVSVSFEKTERECSQPHWLSQNYNNKY